MRGIVPGVVILLALVAGCAGHYHRVKDGVVYLYVTKHGAQDIYFASSIDGYELHKAKKIDENTWEVAVPAYAEFRYFYIADGVVYLPPCRLRERDDFGSENCIFIPGV